MTEFDYIAICDPACVQRLGHNLVAATRYAKHLSAYSKSIEIFAGISLATDPETSNSNSICLNKHYSHYYAKAIPVPLDVRDLVGAKLSNSSAEEAHELAKVTAISELQAVIAKAKKHRKSALFFPSVDYYSLCAITHAVKYVSAPAGSLHVFIRFIGVMENTMYSQNSNESLAALLIELAQASEKNAIHFCYSAESTALALKMEALLKRDIMITPTLVEEELMSNSRSKKFTFCFPGSARVDKGFNRIEKILMHIDKRFPFLDYKVYLQSLPPREIVSHYNAKRSLYKNSRVNAYPASVSQATLEQYIQNSHLVVMPYCPRSYKERSSAMMAESACYGRQIVASSNCGFSDQVNQLGIGLTCETDEEIAEAIINFALMDRDTLNQRALRARNNYLDFARTSYSQYFSPMP